MRSGVYTRCLRSPYRVQPDGPGVISTDSFVAAAPDDASLMFRISKVCNH